MRSAKMKWELALLLIGLAVFHPTAVKGKGSAEEFQRPLLSVEYEYSRSGQITGRKINGRKQSYQYDRKGQLLGVYDENGKALEEYVYDPAGNILKKTIHGRTTTYKYDKANQLVSSEKDGKVTKYEYDAAGRLVKEGEKVYDYIGFDKLSSVSENGRELSSFSYDISGQLAEAVTPEKREIFQWDGLALIQRDSTCYVNEPSITGGNPILADGRVLFNDMLGTTLGVKEGNQVTANSLTAFGEPLSTSPMEDSFFTGKPHVGEMGYAFLFRAYRADLGKWQTSDPLGYPDGWNNFAYVNNSLLHHVDKYGLAVGDIYKTIDAAAEAWGYEFNKKSINEKVEYASTIYKNGTGYSYTDPRKGTHDESVPSLPIPDDPDVSALSLVVAEIHSHGEYDPSLGNGSDVFSQKDMEGYDAWEHYGYLTTPNGSLQKYNPYIEDKTKRITLISDRMPYDPNHPSPLKPVKE